REALELAEKSKPDLILMDIYMKGMDGIAACAELKKNPKLASIPVVMCTALSLLKDINRAFAAGASDYITKPIDKKVLLEKIEKYILKKG
ncbi:MAG TPA: response regulator, partial [bacterium]|nr:response regulator [bacterium]